MMAKEITVNGELTVKTASGFIQIKEEHGRLHIFVMAHANELEDQDVDVQLSVGDWNTEAERFNWRSDAMLYHAHNGRIIGKDQTHYPYKETAVVKTTHK